MGETVAAVDARLEALGLPFGHEPLTENGRAVAGQLDRLMTALTRGDVSPHPDLECRPVFDGTDQFGFYGYMLRPSQFDAHHDHDAPEDPRGILFLPTHPDRSTLYAPTGDTVRQESGRHIPVAMRANLNAVDAASLERMLSVAFPSQPAPETEAAAALEEPVAADVDREAGDGGGEDLEGAVAVAAEAGALDEVAPADEPVLLVAQEDTAADADPETAAGETAAPEAAHVPDGLVLVPGVPEAVADADAGEITQRDETSTGEEQGAAEPAPSTPDAEENTPQPAVTGDPRDDLVLIRPGARAADADRPITTHDRQRRGVAVVGAVILAAALVGGLIAWRFSGHGRSAGTAQRPGGVRPTATAPASPVPGSSAGSGSGTGSGGTTTVITGELPATLHSPVVARIHISGGQGIESAFDQYNQTHGNTATRRGILIATRMAVGRAFPGLSGPALRYATRHMQDGTEVVITADEIRAMYSASGSRS